MNKLFKLFSKRVLKDDYCYYCGLDGHDYMLEIDVPPRVKDGCILLCEDCFKELK